MAIKGYTDIEIEATINCMSMDREGYINNGIIKRIIKNRRYYGYVFYKGKEYKGIIPPIITQNEYEKAQRIHKLQDKEAKKFIFNKRVQCKECGEFVMNHQGTSQTGKKYLYYYCSNCKNISIKIN